MFDMLMPLPIVKLGNPHKKNLLIIKDEPILWLSQG